MSRILFTAGVCSIALLAGLPAGAAEAAATGAIAGHVRYLGSRTVPPVRVPPDAVKVCGKMQPSPALIMAKDKGLANAVVSLNGVRSSAPLAPIDVAITQESCSFEPHVVAVPVGSRLTFVNSDLCLHNVHLLSKGVTIANIGMPLQGQKSKLPVSVLAKPGNVRFKCDVHAWMDGYVHVFDHPWYAVTDRTGAFRIEGIPPGTHDLQVEHEILGGSLRKVTVAAGVDTKVDVDLK
jgi:plastocyanin